MDAMTRFEAAQGTQFEVYAAQRIRGAMLDELRANDWLPRSARQSQRDIENAIHSLEGKSNRAPHESEIAGELEMSLPQYQQMLHDARGAQLVIWTIWAARATMRTTLSATWCAILRSRRKSCVTSAFAMRWSMRSMSCRSAKNY